MPVTVSFHNAKGQEEAGGVGHLLTQQLLSAGEWVLDVPPKLAARVRLLKTGDVNKNDPNDARSVAVATLCSADVRETRKKTATAVRDLSLPQLKFNQPSCFTMSARVPSRPTGLVTLRSQS